MTGFPIVPNPYSYNDYTTSATAWTFTPTVGWDPGIKAQYERTPDPEPKVAPSEAWLDAELEAMMSVGRRERVLA